MTGVTGAVGVGRGGLWPADWPFLGGVKALAARVTAAVSHVFGAIAHTLSKVCFRLRCKAVDVLPARYVGERLDPTKPFMQAVMEIPAQKRVLVLEDMRLLMMPGTPHDNLDGLHEALLAIGQEHRPQNWEKETRDIRRSLVPFELCSPNAIQIMRVLKDKDNGVDFDRVSFLIQANNRLNQKIFDDLSKIASPIVRNNVMYFAPSLIHAGTSRYIKSDDGMYETKMIEVIAEVCQNAMNRGEDRRALILIFECASKVIFRGMSTDVQILLVRLCGKHVPSLGQPKCQSMLNSITVGWTVPARALILEAIDKIDVRVVPAALDLTLGLTPRQLETPSDLVTLIQTVASMLLQGIEEQGIALLQNQLEQQTIVVPLLRLKRCLLPNTWEAICRALAPIPFADRATVVCGVSRCLFSDRTLQLEEMTCMLQAMIAVPQADRMNVAGYVVADVSTPIEQIIQQINTLPRSYAPNARDSITAP